MALCPEESGRKVGPEMTQFAYEDKRAVSKPENTVSMQDVITERFIVNALKVAPAKDHKTFRLGLEAWLASMTEEGMNRFLREYQSRGQHMRTKIASDLYKMYKQKGG